MMPIEPGRPPAGPEVAGEVLPESLPVEVPEFRWYHKMYAVVFVTFCLEIGIFLLVFPWTEYWDANYFSALLPGWHQYWDNTYVRGAISGLGVVNLYIAFIEAFRLRRFARR
jgi:hypothetical protein